MANEIITTLHPDQDPDTNLYPNIKKDNIPNNVIDYNKLSPDVQNLLNSINELNPSGVDTSTHILAFTSDKGIYIGSDTGYWYFWDGTHYVSGGQYLVDVNVNLYHLLAVGVSKIKFDIDTTSHTFTITSIVDPTIQGNSYIMKQKGYIGYLNLSNTSVSFPDNTNDTYLFVIRNNVLLCLSSTYDTLQVNDTIIAIIYFFNGAINKKIWMCDDIDKIEKRLTIMENKISAKYMTNSVNIKFNIDSENHTFNIIGTTNSEYNGSPYFIYDRGYIAYNSLLHTSVEFTPNISNSFIFILRNLDLYCYLVKQYTPQENDYILYICYMDTGNKINKVIFDCTNYANKEQINQPKSHSVNILKKVACIGDSYTSGYINISGTPIPNNPDYAFPKYMTTKTGNKWDNYGVSGSSTKSWVEKTSGKLTELQAPNNKYQAYLIGLMINDQTPTAYNYVPLGSISDIGTDNNSYYAYLYKLIQAVIEINSTAKIFVETCPKTGGNYSGYNQAVRDVVDYCNNTNNQNNVYLLDLASNRYFNYQYFNNEILRKDYINTHYTSIGYEFFAECLINVISDYINDHISKFRDIHLVPYDN